MDKFLSRAEDLLIYTDSLLEDFSASLELNRAYTDLLLDIQLLFFADSPQNPLYIQSIALNKRKDTVLERYCDYFSKNDFETLRKLISKYLQYRSFLQEED